MLERHGTGVATYARSLRAAQLAIDREAILLSTSVGSNQEGPLRRFARALVPGPRRAARDRQGFAAPDLFRVAHVHFTLYRHLLAVRLPGPPGLIHWSYPVPLRVEGWRNVYTVHDAIPLTRPDLSSIDRHRHRRVLTQIMRTADRVITVSDAARAEISAETGCDPAMVVNCSQPVDIPCADPGTPPHELKKHGYLLVCGAVEPRKNIARLLAAHRLSDVSLPLIVAGPEGWRAEALEPLIAAAPNVRRLPCLDRPALIALMAGARALLMPSLAEGFGLPAAEAMALGVPVLASRGGALAETVGDAALLVDPEDEAAIAAAIAQLTEDGVLCAELARRGRDRARLFAPDRFAARLAAVYTDVFARSPISA